jgi:hypothetical protein
VFAVIVGFAWLVAVENIVTRIVPSTEQWPAALRDPPLPPALAEGPSG